jgi:hypothetical protein
MDCKNADATITALIDEFRKAQPADLGRIFNSFSRYIPDHTSRIAPVVVPRIVGILTSPAASPQSISQSIDFLHTMLSRVTKGNSATDPFPFFCQTPNFLAAVFSHVGVNSKLDFDQRVLTILLSHLLPCDSTRIFAFLRDSKASILPLLEGCAKTSDYNACLLAHQLITTNPDILASLVDSIKPLLRHFPPQLLVGLIFANETLRATITDSEFENYLIGRTHFSVPDVREVCRHFPSIWNQVLSLKMLLLTTPPDRTEFVNWIYFMERQDFDLPPDLTQICMDSILSAKVGFEAIDDSNVTVNGLYLFPRLYTLSFADPSELSEKVIDRLYALTADADPYAVSGAVQTLSFWIAKRHFVPPDWTAYQIAALVDGAADGIAQLYRLALHLYASVVPAVEAMLMTDGSVRVSAGQSDVSNEPWLFPHLRTVFADVPSFEGYEEKAAFEALGEVAEYFGINF